MLVFVGRLIEKKQSKGQRRPALGQKPPEKRHQDTITAISSMAGTTCGRFFSAFCLDICQKHQMKASFVGDS